MKLRLFLLIFLGLIVCAFYVSALDNGIGQQTQGVQEGVAKTQEQIDEIKVTFLDEQWKELFLKNKVIGAIDAFFHKINLVFVILFARSYSFSLEMFFAFLLWLTVLLFLPGYMYFMDNKWYRLLSALILTIILAQLQIFNSISLLMMKAFLYSTTWYWSLIIFFMLLVALFVLFYINKILGTKLRKTRERNKSKGFEYRVKVLEAYKGGLRRADEL